MGRSVSEPFGIVGVFATPQALKEAAAQLRDVGLRAVEAYTPYPVEGIGEILHPGRQLFLPLLMSAGALFGACWGYFIQYWDEAIDYPLNVGGRPYNSWPAFVVSAFEFTLLVAVAAGMFGLLLASRLPRLYHPVFNASDFPRASRDRFVLCVEARDPGFEAAMVRRILQWHGAESVEEVAQ